MASTDTATVTFRVPCRIAEALTYAARCSSSLNAAGEIVSEHVILWKPDKALQQTFKEPSNPP